MSLARWTGFLLAAICLVSLPVGAQNPPAKAVKLKTVKYAGLAETVVQNRGKVVVVDLWGFF